MKKYILLFLLIGITSQVQAATSNISVESRVYLERFVSQDKYPFTDFGAAVKLQNSGSSITFRKGTVFSPFDQGALDIGNHQWNYDGLNFAFYDVFVKGMSLSVEVLTSVEPFEGNDFNLKKSYNQGLGVFFKGFSANRGKWVNGDGYTNLGYDKKIKNLPVIGDISASGKMSFRASRYLINSQYVGNLNYLECGVSHWSYKKLNDNLELAIKGRISYRRYFEEPGSNIYYTVSIGLVAK